MVGHAQKCNFIKYTGRFFFNIFYARGTFPTVEFTWKDHFMFRKLWYLIILAYQLSCSWDASSKTDQGNSFSLKDWSTNSSFITIDVPLHTCLIKRPKKNFCAWLSYNLQACSLVNRKRHPLVTFIPCLKSEAETHFRTSGFATASGFNIAKVKGIL